MTRFLLQISYDGKRYHGFQTQPKKITIQQQLEKNLKKILREKITVIPSGRTDKGVHALAQIIHCDVKSAKAILRLQDKKFLRQINSLLPADISVVNIEKVASDFHARAQAQEKTYKYVIMIAAQKNPFLEEFCWRIDKQLDIEKMKRAANELLGTHDFSSFCASDTAVKTKVRTIKSINFETKNPFSFLALPNNKFITMSFCGSGFLKQMIRNIVGTLYEVGIGKISPEKFKQILSAQDRRQAAKTAPANGLFLDHVKYGRKTKK